MQMAKLIRRLKPIAGVSKWRVGPNTSRVAYNSNSGVCTIVWFESIIWAPLKTRIFQTFQFELPGRDRTRFSFLSGLPILCADPSRFYLEFGQINFIDGPYEARDRGALYRNVIPLTASKNIGKPFSRFLEPEKSKPGKNARPD